MLPCSSWDRLYTGFEDCNAGTETLEQLRNRFPEYQKMDEVLFNLYYCYNKNGETAKAEGYQKTDELKNMQAAISLPL